MGEYRSNGHPIWDEHDNPPELPSVVCLHPFARRAPFVGLPIIWKCATCGGLMLSPGYERAS